MKKFSRFFPLVIVIILTILLFGSGIFNSFFQDDFIHLNLGWIKKSEDLFNLIKPVDYFPYRPVAIQMAGFVSLHIFRLNPLPSHLLLLVLHLVNIILLWKVLDSFRLTQFAKSMSIFFYGLSTIHFMLLYWWSILYVLLGTTFFLINCLILEKVSKKRKYYFPYFVILFLMYLTNEALVVYPLWIILFVYFFNKKLKKIIFLTISFTLIFLAVRLNLAKYPQSSDYIIGNLVQILKTTQWYFLRSLNIVEGIKSMDLLVQKIVYFIFGFISVLLLSIFYFHQTHKLNINRRLIVFGLSWYLILAFPFFLLPNHISPFYLNTALAGLSLSIGTFFQPICNQKMNFGKYIILGILFFYTLLSFINVSYLKKTHWVVWRAEIAKTYLEKVKMTYPILPKGAAVVFKETKIKPSEIAVVLSGNKALRLYYNDPSLKVIYNDQADSSENIYSISE